MTLQFTRCSVVGEVAAVLRARLLAGAWPDWLPSERQLSRQLAVSRNTCHAALEILYGEGRAQPVRGRGIRACITKGAAPAAPVRSVGGLLPAPRAQLPAPLARTLGYLQKELFDGGQPLRVHAPRPGAETPAGQIDALLGAERPDCWIAFQPSAAVQQALQQRGVPCLIVGAAAAGITLPAIDFSPRAVSRHAVGRLVALGHRRIAYLTHPADGPADEDGERGALQAAWSSSGGAVELRVLRHEGAHPGRVAEFFPGGDWFPTAWVVSTAGLYVWLVATLARAGWRVPAEVSVICVAEVPFAAQLDPAPTHYVFDSRALARKTAGAVRAMLELRRVGGNAGSVFPRFEPGASVGRFGANVGCSRVINPAAGGRSRSA